VEEQTKKRRRRWSGNTRCARRGFIHAHAYQRFYVDLKFDVHGLGA